MTTWQVKLIPKSSFNILPSSTTLFGAICWGIKAIYGEKELIDILQEIEETPFFVISSAFPCVETNGTPIYFYPKPFLKGLTHEELEEISKELNVKDLEVAKEYKKFKNAKYVSEKIFERIIQGTSEKELFKELLGKKIQLTGNMLAEEKIETQIKEVIVQKNLIDRLSTTTENTGETFYEMEYFVSPRVGFHFLIKTENINFFIPVFRYLEDTGIGGNRSVGKGVFKIHHLPFKEFGEINSRNFIILSRYIPKRGEINFDSKNIFYKILPLRTKVESRFEFKGEDIWKAKVMYLKEGSSLEANEKKEFYGRCPVVKEIDNKKILHNGLAFPVFFKVSDES